MPDLIAQGTDPADRWRRTLSPGRVVVLGRASDWSAAWDPLISRRHVELIYSKGALEVRRLADARNPVFYRGRPVDRLSLRPAEHFVIGDTSFTLLDEHVAMTLDAPRPDVQETFTVDDLRRLRFRDAEGRIDVLSRLPALIAGAADERELHARVVNVLLVGVRSAAAAALVTVDAMPNVESPDASAPVAVLHWDRRRLTGESFAPSQRLIVETVRRGQSILHVWRPGGTTEFTVAAHADWAFAAPLPGEACRGWALYAEGRFVDTPLSFKEEPAEGRHDHPLTDVSPEGIEIEQRAAADHAELAPLREDLKFTELVGGAVASWCDNQRLRECQAALKPFFSPQVLAAIARDDPRQALAPRPADVTVMFCDLRGFSRASERATSDLMALLQRVSRALGVSTQHILDHGGVVGDFQGDAVMGFWGWPLAEPDRAGLASQAALGIQRQCQLAAGQSDHPLTDFRVGIGIATGPAVAGQIGTAAQSKVTVFGPVVNLASRLEGMTRLMGADILLDEATAADLASRQDGPPCRLRRLAVVRPYGLQTPLAVSQLLGADDESPEVRDAALAQYASALEDFAAGRWPEARAKFDSLLPQDRAAGFLRGYIDQHHGVPPPDFDGVITLTSK